MPPIGLWEKTHEQVKSALASGDLLSVETRLSTVEDEGIPFIVHQLAHFKEKQRVAANQKKLSEAGNNKVNPFLPYDKAMFVSDIGRHHICLLNKYPVIKNHLILVTKEFEPQSSLLTPSDFTASAHCLKEADALFFYNGGKEAGASQNHKHLQCIPFPSPGHKSLPMASLFPQDSDVNNPVPLFHLPFRNVFCSLPDFKADTSAFFSQKLYNGYRCLLQHAGLNKSNDSSMSQTGPYNLIFNRRWMFLVPRSKEYYQSISVNSLGFTGGFLVKNTAEMAMLKKKGPFKILSEVGIAW